MEKNFVIIAGPNGAGKTTSAMVLLPDFLKTNEFVNADEIAKGISPFNPSSVAVKAGKIMIERINELLDKNKSFAIETTLSGTGHATFIEKAKSKSYTVGLVFLYLDSYFLAQERVLLRVKRGGHDIPSETIERRYLRGLHNLVNIYKPIVDWLYVLDNVKSNRSSIYYRDQESENILDKKKWERINEQAKKNKL